MAATQRPAFPTPIRALPRLRVGKVAVVAAAGLVIGLALLQVQQFSAVTSTGYEIESLQRQELSQRAANHELEAEVAQLSSLARVDYQARVGMGLEPAKRIFYINVNQPLPDTGQLPERFEPATPAPAERESDRKSFWSRLLEHLPF